MDLEAMSAPARSVLLAVEALRPTEAGQLPAGQALEDLRALVIAQEQLGVVLLARLRDMDTRQLYDLDDYASTGSWLDAQRTSADRSVATLARRLDRLPAAGRELQSGRLSIVAAKQVGWAVEQVRGFLDRPSGLIDEQPAEAVLDAVIVDGVCMLYGEALGGLADDDPRLVAVRAEVTEISGRVATQIERVEAAFVALACRIEHRFLRPALQRLVDALLPVRLEERAEAVRRRRALVLVHHDDQPGGRLEADLDEELYELLHGCLAAAMATDPENATDTEAAAARRAAGLDPYAPGFGPGPRSVLARRHDALSRILRDWLASGVAGLRGKSFVQINVTCPLAVLSGAPGALPAVGESGKTLSGELVRRWWCDSTVGRFVLSLGNKVLETSHTQRTLHSHERRAKLIETGGRCEAAFCPTPPGVPLVPHHPNAWARTQSTSFFDTTMLCEHHHHDLHDGRRTLRIRDGRLLSPAGWVAQVGAVA